MVDYGIFNSRNLFVHNNFGQNVVMDFESGVLHLREAFLTKDLNKDLYGNI